MTYKQGEDVAIVIRGKVDAQWDVTMRSGPVSTLLVKAGGCDIAVPISAATIYRPAARLPVADGEQATVIMPPACGEHDPAARAAFLRSLADWFDTDDWFKTAMFPETWPPGSRPDDLQRDLREWADALDGAR